MKIKTRNLLILVLVLIFSFSMGIILYKNNNKSNKSIPKKAKFVLNTIDYNRKE
ncbi:hypothetical protein [Anaerosalibacter massiliensis]|uniref:Uncharacterized protein n=1 Tax=Anaerosalibacter massiliensis TaxID=1347392 RepID=A0A9X2MKK4_9FIRM|nr:hypothetical protein [Anaerosalibacter massiliensis]MCR2042966.1 hypothetical protein [Anaerosalibacter massiliensis]